MALDEKLDARFDEPPCEPAGDARPEDPVSEEEERRLVRKLDRRILPIACLLYLFACQSDFGRSTLTFLAYTMTTYDQTWTEVIWVTLVCRA